MLPLTTIPDTTDQCRIIRDLLRSSIISPSSFGYLISSKWFNEWKEYVGFNGHTSYIKASPIDNNGLISKEDNQVRPDARLGFDYEVVTEQIYTKLHDWYGGGPTLRRNVEYDPIHECNDVIVRKPQFDIYFQESHHTFEYSRYQPIIGLKKQACDFFKVSDQRSRLCDYFMKIRETELNEDKILAYYSIPNNSSLLLEEQNNDGSWPEFSMSKVNEFWTSLDRSDPGMHGLQGFTNCCYLNCVLQCFAHAVPIIPYFSGNEWKHSINESNGKGTRGRLAEAFAELIHEMWKSKTPIVSPRFIKDVISEYAPIFMGEEPQDAHELITYILDLVHEDLNRARETKPGPYVEGNIGNDIETSHKAWQRHTKINDSFIVDNFHGMFRSRIECQKCHQCSVVFDPYSTISLALPLPLQKTHPFLFVPWDLKQPRVKMQLKLNNPTLLTEVIDGICTRMKRQMNIIFAEHRHNSIELEWLTSLEVSSRDFKIVAFELPPHSPDTIFAQTRIMAPILSANRKTQKQIDPFCLVDLPTTEVTQDTAQEACERRFDPLFSPSTGDVTNQKIKDIMKNLYPPQAPYDWQRLKAKIFSRSYEKTVTFDRDVNVPIVTKRRIDVRLNSAIIRDPTKFEWTAMQHIINTVEAPIESAPSTFFTLKECFDLFVGEEMLSDPNTHFCQFCREHVYATKKMDIWSAPRVLIVHLKRFQSNIYNKRKLDMKVNYPDILDLSQYVIGDQEKENLRYRLYGVIEHNGTLEGGHYDTIIFQHQREKWYKFNDNSVQIIKKGKAHSQDAYVLFYSRIDA